jgi:glycosyltransferase involved in cell wall biosynthesis
MDFWGLPDRELYRVTDIESRVLKILKSVKPQVVFLPSLQEFHPDHRAATFKIWSTLQKLHYSGQLWTYEIVRQAEANRLIDITKVISIKQQAMRCYKSQLALNNYEAVVTGINQARALTLQQETTHAEAFFEYDGWQNLCPCTASMTTLKPYWQSDSMAGDSPLVSIIIRTKDRPRLLREALTSIAEQTYPNIEAVVVNDGGQDIKDLAKELLGQAPLTYVYHEKNQGRAAAANSGLNASKGLFLNFLDDDDVLYPEHVEVLLNKLLSLGYKVAYSGVKNVFYEGPPSRPGRRIREEVTFNHPFDRELLLFENYIPLMSVLFSRDVVGEVKGFCEDLDLFEDWDFLVRASRYFDFLHVDRITAEYRFYGVNTVEEAHRASYSYNEALVKAFERFHPFMTGKSWLRHLSGGLVGRLKADVKKLEEELERKSASIEGYQRHVTKQEEIIENFKDQIEGYQRYGAEVEQIIENFKGQITHLQGSVEGYQRYGAELEQIIENFKGQVAQLQGEVANYKNRIERLKRNPAYWIYRGLKRLVPTRIKRVREATVTDETSHKKNH